MKKERVNYVVTSDTYVGHTANLPLVVQADSLEQLNERMKELLNGYISHLIQLMNSDDPFELVEIEDIFKHLHNDQKKEAGKKDQ